MDPTDLDTGIPVPDELDLVADSVEETGGADDVERLLAGRFFTIGNGGSVSAWNSRAQGVYGFSNAGIVGESFVEKLIAPDEREKRSTEIDALLSGDGPLVAVHIDVRAVNADGVEFGERFAVVPIRLHDGYELNNLLQDVGMGGEKDRLRKKHADVIELIEGALAGRVEAPGDGEEDAQRVVGALIIFDGTGAAPTLGDGESPEDDLESAKQELGHLRSQLAEAQRETEEARRDADAAREEVEKTRAKLSDVRGSADEEQGRAQQLDVELDKLRGKAEDAEARLEKATAELDELRAANESLRGELEGNRDEVAERLEATEAELADAVARREELERELEAKTAELDRAQTSGDEQTEALRRELEDARAAQEDAAAKLAEKEGELSELASKREELADELDAKRTELDEVAARRDELAGKLNETDADLADLAVKRGELAEELEAKRAELAEVAGRRDELAAQLDAKESELAEAAGRSGELAKAVEEKEAEIEATRAQGGEESEALRSEIETLRKDIETLRAERDELVDERDKLMEELTEARAAADEAKGEAERRQARVDELAEALQEARKNADDSGATAEEAGARILTLEGELAEAREEVETARTSAEQAKAELETANSSAEEARLQAKGAVGELDEARHQVELFRGAFDTAPIGMALTAPDGRFVKVNKTLCDELGYTEEQLLSDDPPSIVHPDDVDANREMARRLIAGEITSSRAERRYMHADGHEIQMRESVALVRDGNDTPLLFIFQLEDATEQIELGAADHARELGAAGDALPVPLGRHSADPANLEGPFLSPERVQQALAEDQFVLYCQPVLDLRSNEISQYELLIRMIDDDGRLILPQAFLKPAEQAGLIKQIDHWVVRRAIRLIAENRDAGRDVNIEINVSPESLVDSDLIQVIDQELAAHPIDPANLIVEVVEAAAASNPEGAATLAKGVRALGARFALDDFGSTFGSFRHLKDLALDFLKIDGDLVSSLTESRTSQLVVKALVDVARGTGTETIAVFVSDDETLMLLRQHGVGYAQGYVVGRPQPLSEVFADGRAALPPAG